MGSVHYAHQFTAVNNTFLWIKLLWKTAEDTEVSCCRKSAQHCPKHEKASY